HRGRDTRPAWLLDHVQEPRPADHRRGAALRRQAQGTPEGAEERRARPDAVGDANPTNAATGIDGRSRAFAHHDTAGRPHGGPYLHLTVRSSRDSRNAATRALSRRPEL